MADSKKHTPGPWEWQSEYDIEAYPEEAGRLYVVGSNLGGLVGVALPWATEIDSRDFKRVEANARLIAAAPDLLEALKSFQSYGCPVCAGDCASANPPVHSCPMQMAYSAIARAEGRS